MTSNLSTSRNSSSLYVSLSDDDVWDMWMISDEVMSYIFTINMSIGLFVISIFGITANAINMIVFHRIGFQDTINISLFALAISDICSLLPFVLSSICFFPLFRFSDLPVNAMALQHRPGGLTHLVFGRITGFITVFITLERCLCIAFPLKVKRIFTRSRVTGILIGIFVVIIATMIPNYCADYLGWKWDPIRNRSIIDITRKESADDIENVLRFFQMAYPFITFCSVSICTVIFVWKLNQRGKWLKSASGNQEKSTSNKDQQVIKMVVVVAIIFIVCYIPSIFSYAIFTAMPESNIGGKYENLFFLTVAIFYNTEAINSSVNIFVYYKMMSKYRSVFLSLFRRTKQKLTK